jgi:hypothetical protein
MKRSIFALGSIMLFFGFILYQLGMSSELHQTTFLARWLGKLAEPLTCRGLSLEIVSIILQFVGGLIAIFGLVICFAGVARSKTQILTRAMESKRSESKAVSTCKFCGADIEEGLSFCPKCNKSLK